MIINFDEKEEQVIKGFKGGKGEFRSRRFDDGEVKVMRNILPPGSQIGLHTHTADSEVMYILKGTITFHCDGNTEIANAGDVHYCPRGHEHYAENLTNEDAEFIAVVTQMNL